VLGSLKDKKALSLIVVLLAFLFVVMLVPELSLMIGVLIPVPLTFVYVRFGRRVGLVLLAFISIVLLTLIGPKQAILFFTEYAILAGVMAEAIRFRLSFDKCIVFGTLVSSALSIAVLLFVFVDREATLLQFFQKQIDGHFSQSVEALKAMGDKSEEIKLFQDFAVKASDSLVQAYPSFIALGAFITALINYYATRFLWRRIDNYDMFHPARFSGWVVPDNVVWILIGSSTAFFLADNTLGFIGINLLVISLIAYFFQGLAIIIFFLESRNVPVFFWIIIFFVIILQPLLVGASIGLGVFDSWMDLRKVRVIEKQKLE
jgi:uncharacterized protein YybS (DUF2232 family)